MGGKKIMAGLLAFLLLLTGFTGLDGLRMTVSALDGRVETAVQAAIAIANDQSHGYSQTTRYGNPNYDCSSLVCSVFHNAGFSVEKWGTTASMVNSFKNAGFTYITGVNFSSYGSLQRGDILWKSGHTEIYIGDGKLVGAHSNKATSSHPNRSAADGDQGDEISVCSYYNAPWTGILRYNGSEPWDITKPSTYPSYPGSVIKSGAKGDTVRFIQTGLITLGYSCGNAGADGDFGSGTLAAVKSFQGNNGLSRTVLLERTLGISFWSISVRSIQRQSQLRSLRPFRPVGLHIHLIPVIC